MNVSFKLCRADEEYAAYCNYFIQHRKQFHASYMFGDAIAHLVGYLQEARIVLVLNDMEQIVGAGHYMIVDEEQQFDANGTTAFIPTTILSPGYRQSRVFYTGLREFVRIILTDAPQVNKLQFEALAENVYLNRLYSKFASPIGEQEGPFGNMVIYSTDVAPLKNYLRIS
ncbi:hypothetical protein ACX93W_13225 [Paenibacillus sp. CAU 1782]